MGNVLSPSGLPKTTIKATGGPVGDAINDAVWRVRVTKGEER